MTEQLTFGPFRLDRGAERVWRGTEPLALRPKAYAVLAYLLERPGELVTKQQLLDAVWPDTFVTDGVLKDSIKQIREALDDDPATPRFIETAHRRGYRLIAPVSTHTAAPAPQAQAAATAAAATPFVPIDPVVDGVRLLGREAETHAIEDALMRAVRGERQTVFVTGEPGIGKTTLVGACVEALAPAYGVRVARGQCLEQFGVREAYLPVLDAISRLARSAIGPRVVDVLRRHAPAWLGELPSLLTDEERVALEPMLRGASRERMLREMADALEVLAADAPVMVVLEDLHWSDYSTIDLIAYVARRREPARLLIVGTYRPVDVILTSHPLAAAKRELQLHRLCKELPLEYLTEDSVLDYLTLRFADRRVPRWLARLIHRRTEGNPLFMVNLVDHLVAEGLIVAGSGPLVPGSVDALESGVPENIRQLIERQIERLADDERRVLEAASVVGIECSVTAIAAGLAERPEWVEQRCESLARRHQFLTPARLVALPDGSVTPRYRFTHVLHLEVPYAGIPPMQRAQIHGRIGASGEAVYGSRVNEIAAELAVHFEQARDAVRAVHYLLMAAQNAMHRSAHHEAAALARHGLEVLATIDAASAEQQLTFRTILAVALMATHGHALPDVELALRPAVDLTTTIAPSPQTFVAQWLWGLMHYFRGNLRTAFELATALLPVADALNDPICRIEAHRACGVCLVELGRFREAVVHFDAVAEAYQSPALPGHGGFGGHDPLVVSGCFAARALWALGCVDQAATRAQHALELARSLGHAQTVVVAAFFGSHVHLRRGDIERAREYADEALALSDEYGLGMWATLAGMQRTLCQRAGDREAMHRTAGELRESLAAYRATGGALWAASFEGALATLLSRAGDADAAVTTVAGAIADAEARGEGAAIAELYRIHGDILARRAFPDGRLEGSAVPKDAAAAPLVADAHEYYRRSLALAREQDARSIELRTSLSVARLRRATGEGAAARRALTGVLRHVVEGEGTADVLKARQFLA